jgi:hypothetical protein
VVIPDHHIRSYLPVMNQAPAATGGPSQAGQYEIRIEGHLDTRWTAWFDGLALTHETDGTTVLHGPVVDQAALHGLLQKVRDLGLPLVSVIHVAPDSHRSTP